MLDSVSNFNPPLEPSLQSTIIVNTSHLQTLTSGKTPKRVLKRSKKPGKPQNLEKPQEPKKGFKIGQQKNNVPTKHQARTRLMITFESEAGYRLLLDDKEELLDLRESSYLDQDFLAQNNQYRVHLYCKPRSTIRIGHWEYKYPQIKKTVALDERDIRFEIDLENNSLSRAIANAQAEAKAQAEAEKLQHPHPPTPPGYARGKKKIKMNEKRKTKADLLSENQALREDLLRTQKEVQQFLKRQNRLKSVCTALLQKLSPTSKVKFENILESDEEEALESKDVLTTMEMIEKDLEEDEKEDIFEEEEKEEEMISSNKKKEEEVILKKRKNSQNKEDKKTSSPDDQGEMMLCTSFSDHGNSSNISKKSSSVLQKCDKYLDIQEEEEKSADHE